MTKALRRSPLFAVLVALGVSLFAAPASAATHPSLLFSTQDIPAIRANLDGPLKQVKDALAAGVHFPYVGNYPKTADLNYQYFNDRRAIADTLLAFAFGAAVLDPASQPGKEANELALNYLRGICGYSDWVFAATQDGPDPDLNSAHFLFAVAVSYDWLYDRLSESDRQACRNRVSIEGDKMYQAATHNVWWVPELLQNHNWINHASLGMAALAFAGEIPNDTNKWLQAAKDDLAKVQYVLDLIHGATWHEGTGYLHYGLDSLIPFGVALERAGQGPDYADNQVVRDYATMRMQMMPPALAHKREFVLWGDFSNMSNENTLLPLYYAARKYRDGNAAWYANEFLAGQTQGKAGLTSWPPGQKGMLMAVPLYDASVTPVRPDPKGGAWELDYYGHDLSLFTSRSGWEDGGSLLALKAGVFGGWGNYERLMSNGWPGGTINFGHDHDDDMGLQFFGDGEWLTTRVPGYFIGRDNGAVQVNKTRFANSLLVDDKGQLGEGIRNCWMGSCPWFWTRQGSIPIRGSTAHFSYALGAGSGLYDPALGLSGFGRSVLYLDRRFPVVRDVVRGNTARTYEIVWHAIDGAARDGAWLKLAAKNDRALGVKVVAPASFEVRTENQTATHLDGYDSDGSMTAMMVRPTTRSAETTFLSALVPARSSTWAQKAQVDPIDPAVADRGLVLTALDGQKYEVVFNDAPEGTSTAAGITVTGMAGVRKTAGGTITRAMLAAGSRLEFDGTAWIEVLDGTRATVEVEPTETGIAISGDERALRVYAPGTKSVTYNGVSVPFKTDGDYVLPGSAPSGGEGGAGGAGGSGGSDGQGGTGGSTPCVPNPVDGSTQATGGTTPTTTWQTVIGGNATPGSTTDVEGGCDPAGTGGTGGGNAGGETTPTKKKKGFLGCSTASGDAAGALGVALAALGFSMVKRRRD